MKKLVILGSTGSIGTQTLEVVSENSKELEVVALAAYSNVSLMEQQIRKYHPKYAVMWSENAAKELKILTADCNVEILEGMQGLIQIATCKESDIILTAVVGMIGIIPTIEAIKAKKDIALANKETLVTAGHIIMPLAKEYNVKILPVDSEHSAIFQSMQGQSKDVSKLLLTASGGPFRGLSYEEMKGKTVEDALKHPNWSMGKKITIDSATMVNKGLEVIEAGWLFSMNPEQIEVVVHPQSIIHSMVEYSDGAVIAQLGLPNMKLPIQYALFYPERRKMQDNCLDFASIGNITFEKPDFECFKGLLLGYKAFRAGHSMPTVYNASNERAVSLFLNRKIKFLDIADMIEGAMDNHKIIKNPTVQDILDTEAWCYEFIESRC